MTKNGKILLGCGGVVLVIAVIVLVGGYFGLKYIDKRMDESLKPDEEAGTAYGKTVDQQGCVDEGLRRSRLIPLLAMGRSIALQTFVGACLKNARPVDNFCDGVPSYWDLDDTKWKVAQCHKAKMDEAETSCAMVFSEKKSFCRPAN